MSRPGVTVCIPTIGRMEYIHKTQACFRAQTRKDAQVIILDNGSGPECRAFVDDWARDPNVRVIRSEPRIPMLDNFNLSVRATQTELLTFWHDDDEFMPDYIEKMSALLERFPGAGLAGGNCDFIDEASNVTERRRWHAKDGLIGRREYVSGLVSRGRNIIPMAGLMYRRWILGDGFDTNLPINFGDFVMLMSYAEKADIAVIADSVVRIRRHPIQASNLALSRAIPMRSELLQSYLDGYSERFPEDREMVRKLRRRIRLTHRAGLVWGWASATTDAERNACIESLDRTAIDAALSASLKGISALGVRPDRAAGRAVGFVRRVADSLGL
jgi:glycosyltransferase involved in cell wall biosynthesis